MIGVLVSGEGTNLQALIDDGLPIAAVLLGAALGNKAWAVLAVGPVLVALSRDRLKVLAIADPKLGPLPGFDR